ncbi:MAG: acyl-CoA thioesterase, partial [Gemmatimonadota bacterium]
FWRGSMMAEPDQPPRSGVHHSRVRVRYAETDQQGIAYHAHYLIWMEVGRTEFLDALGFPYRRLEEQGLVFSVVEARCRYMQPARYHDVVEIATRVSELRSRSVVFAYELNAGGLGLAVGETRLLAMGTNRRPRRIPDDLTLALRRVASG